MTTINELIKKYEQEILTDLKQLKENILDYKTPVNEIWLINDLVDEIIGDTN